MSERWTIWQTSDGYRSWDGDDLDGLLGGPGGRIEVVPAVYGDLLERIVKAHFPEELSKDSHAELVAAIREARKLLEES